MLTQGKTPKKKIIIYSLIILAMIAGNIFIYYHNKKDELKLEGTDFISALELDQTLTDLSEPGPDISQSVLEHNVFTTLKKIGDWPVVPTNVGKADPFAPFLADTD